MSIAEDHTSAVDWLRLDNAAKIYPAAYSEVAPEVFRMGMRLDAPIRLSALQAALGRVIARCPYYQVHLRRGFFWYYLQRHSCVPEVELLTDEPVAGISIRRRDEHLFRVRARESTIAIDFSHVLTDGAGATRFLATLVAEYLRQTGVDVPSGGLILDPDEPPHEGEFEDAFRALYRPESPPPEDLSPAYHIPAHQHDAAYRIVTGCMQVDRVLANAKERRVSLTEYLAGILTHAIIGIHERDSARRHTVRVEIPVDLRRFYHSPTMRNFSLFVSPEVDLRLGSYDLEETIQLVHHQVRLQVDLRQLTRQIKRNVGGEMNPFVRIVPLVFKDWYLSSLHHRLGNNLYSGVVSNLGRVDLPESMAEHVERVVFVLGPNPVRRTNCSVLSYKGELSLTFGSLGTDLELERRVFRTLVSHGVRVRIEE